MLDIRTALLTRPFLLLCAPSWPMLSLPLSDISLIIWSLPPEQRASRCSPGPRPSTPQASTTVTLTAALLTFDQSKAPLGDLRQIWSPVDGFVFLCSPHTAAITVRATVCRLSPLCLLYGVRTLRRLHTLSCCPPLCRSHSSLCHSLQKRVKVKQRAFNSSDTSVYQQVCTLILSFLPLPSRSFSSSLSYHLSVLYCSPPLRGCSPLDQL